MSKNQNLPYMEIDARLRERYVLVYLFSLWNIQIDQKLKLYCYWYNVKFPFDRFPSDSIMLEFYRLLYISRILWQQNIVMAEPCCSWILTGGILLQLRQNTVKAEYCHGRILSWRNTVMAEYCHGRMLSWRNAVMAEYCHCVILSCQNTVSVEYCRSGILSRRKYFLAEYCNGGNLSNGIMK